jgi:hypothetical protein
MSWSQIGCNLQTDETWWVCLSRTKSHNERKECEEGNALHGDHNAPFTSRKHGKKEPQSFVHCGRFDHPDLQSQNGCKFFFWFMTAKLKFWGHVIHRWKGSFKTFPAVY